MDLKDLLHQLYHEPDMDTRRYIPDKLAKLGDWGSTRALGELITDTREPEIMRNEAVESLGKQGDPSAVPYLTQVLSDPVNDIRRTAIWSLGQIGTPATLEPVFSLMNDPSVEVRRWVAKSAGRIRSPEVISRLQSYFSVIDPRDIRVMADIFRAVTSQQHYLDESQLLFWEKSIFPVLNSDFPNYVKQAAIILLNHLYTRGIEVRVAELKEVFHSLPPHDPLVRPQIIISMGHAKNISFLTELPLSSWVAEALGIAQETEFLFSLLENNPSDDIVIGILEAFTHTTTYPDLASYYDHSNLTIRMQALQLHALHGLPISPIVGAYQSEKGKFKALELLRYYGSDALSIFEQSALEDEKVARQTTVYSLISDPMISNSQLHEDISNILQKVATSDTIWHIRRDARIGLERIAQN